MAAIFPSGITSPDTDSSNTTFPTSAGGNTSIAEGMAPSGVNNALRSMATMIAASWGGMYSGSARPSAVQTGSLWRDTSGGATANVINYYDGSDDIAICTVNTTANTVSFAGNLTGDVTGDLTGDVTGNVTGNVTGDLTGDVTTLTTRGDLLYQGASADARLAVGSSGQVLKSDGTDPTWGDIINVETTPVATTSGTTVNKTGIASGAKEVVVTFKGVSTDGTSGLLMPIGDSGGIEETSYVSAAGAISGGAVSANTTGFLLTTGLAAAQTYSGKATLTLHEASSNTWLCDATIIQDNGGNVYKSGGYKALSAELDRVQLTTVSGDTFDAGEFNVSWKL